MKFYTLTETVTNPKPDKRRKFDWRSDAQVVEGTKFVVIKRGSGSTIAPVDAVGATLPIDAPLVELMNEHLEPYGVEDADTLVNLCGINPNLLLRKAVKRGALDLDDLHTIIKDEHKKEGK